MFVSDVQHFINKILIFIVVGHLPVVQTIHLFSKLQCCQGLVFLHESNTSLTRVTSDLLVLTGDLLQDLLDEIFFTTYYL